MSTVTYTDEFEDLLKQESERAECMSLLHTRSHEVFNALSVWVNLPVILLSLAVGFLAPTDLFAHQNYVLGAVSMLVAFLKAVEDKFDWTKRSEAHRMVSLAYSRLSKFVQVQLALERRCRINPADILGVITNDLQNLKDSEPTLPQLVVRKFMARVNKDGCCTALPPVCRGLTTVQVNRDEGGSLGTLATQTTRVSVTAGRPEPSVSGVPDVFSDSSALAGTGIPDKQPSWMRRPAARRKPNWTENLGIASRNDNDGHAAPALTAPAQTFDPARAPPPPSAEAGH